MLSDDIHMELTNLLDLIVIGKGSVELLNRASCGGLAFSSFGSSWCVSEQLMEVIRLRSATPADLELLQEWDEQAHVIASDPNSDWGWEVELGRNPDWREQLIAELDGRADWLSPDNRSGTRGKSLLGRCPRQPSRHRHLDRKRNRSR